MERIETILHRQQELEGQRASWESVWREVDARVNPLGEGGFTTRSPGQLSGLDIFDHTAALGLDRFEAAVKGMVIPRGERYHTVTTTSAALNDFGPWLAWKEMAVDRLFAARYSPLAAFEPEAGMNIRSLGSYGSGPFWTDRDPKGTVYYKTFHLAECYVDEDWRGRADTLHRKFEMTARQCEQQFGRERLPERMVEALTANKGDTKFDILHVIRPRKDRDPERLDHRGMPWQSLYIAMADKHELRESGYRTKPFAFPKAAAGPRERYGRSPAINVLGSIRTVNAMAKTLLRAGQRAADPPLLVPEDGVLSTIHTAPGKATVGGLGYDGTPLVVPMQHGGNLPIGMELLNNEREPIRDAFLEKVWSLVLERRDRMTATEVLEISRMQGMLMTPMASRMESEWLGPMIERELDVLMDIGYIPPPPPEFREEGAQLRIIYDNPLSRAAKAEEALGFSRWVEMMAPVAAIDPSIYDGIATERVPGELARALAVRSTYQATPEEIEAKRQAREERQLAELSLGGLEKASIATKNFAQARGEATAFG